MQLEQAVALEGGVQEVAQAKMRRNRPIAMWLELLATLARRRATGAGPALHLRVGRELY
jgi:hypothetical protein